MDKADRTRYRQLANDAIIDTFGSESREQKLAEALEQAINQLDYVCGEWRPVCDKCSESLATYDEEPEDGMIIL